MAATATQLLLASASPRRSELLERLGLDFTVDPSDVDEEALERQLAGSMPSEIAAALASAKAASIADRHPDAVVLAADTMVVIEGVILGKPVDEEDALGMLRRLAGRCHEVITSVVVQAGDRSHGASVTSRVEMRACSDERLRAYIASGEPFDKAGGYAVQGGGATLVKRVEGCLLNVMGLPVCSAISRLARHGLIAEQDPLQACASLTAALRFNGFELSAHPPLV